MAIPLYQSSIDRALASGKTAEQLRTAMQNNKPMAPSLKAKAMAYLDTKSIPVLKLPDATTGPYTKQNADAQVNAGVSVVPTQVNVPQNSITNPSKPNDYSLGETSSTNSGVDRLNTTMDEYGENAKKTAAETEANARKFGDEKSRIAAERDTEKLSRINRQEQNVKDIESRFNSNTEQRKKDAEDMLKEQKDIAAMNSNIAMADAGKSGLQLSEGDLTTVQNDILNKYATNILNATDFKNKTNITLDQALANTGLAFASKQSEIDKFKDAIQDAKYAPIYDAVDKAAAGNQKAIDDVNTFYQEMTKKKADEEYTRVAIDERISAEEKSFSEASSQKKEAILQNEIKDIPGAAYVGTEIGAVLNLYPNASRTFIVGELARRAMANENDRAMILQSIAAGTYKATGALGDEIMKQGLEIAKGSGATVAQKTQQQATAQANNPAQTNNSTYVLSDANKVFIANALRNSSPAKLANMKKILDTQLKNGAIRQNQYDAVRKAIGI